ncbi:MAG: sodium:calcium antiporter [Candidatus Nanohaloarchaeota archaeon QJJ-7]|nr:sodium:calcium antiporter [Candidatus Nanohaloarchaeota archaeon QJJ-7]
MVFGLGFELSLILGALALILLVYGSEEVVDRLTGIAEYYGIPDILIAMTVISVGTSLPELAAHTIGSIGILRGTLNYQIGSATVLGANIGSDVVQQTLVVGVVVFFFAWKKGGKFEFTDRFLKKDYSAMIGTTLMTLVLAWDGVLSRLDGLILMGSFFGYIYYLYHTRHERLNHSVEASDSIQRDMVIFTVSFVTILISAHVVLEVTETVVQTTGLGGSIIGVMTLGLAAALPEMFTAIQGIRQKASGISLGTLIGSNITNPLLGIGFGSLLSTYWVPRPLVLWDLPMETFTAGMLLLYLLFVSDRKLGWKGGIYLIGLYVFYVVIRFAFFAAD